MAGDESVTVADAMSVGMLAHFLGRKKETIHRKLHAALSQVEKK